MNHLEKIHESSMQESGLRTEIILEHGIRSAQGDEIETVLNWGSRKHLGSGYIIPYPSETGFLPDHVHVRLDIPYINSENKEAKYLCPIGSKSRLYIPIPVWKVLKDINVPLFITEGQKKALKAVQEGFFCIGLSGVWNFSSERMLLSDFDMIQLLGRTIYIVYDGDKKENPHVKLAETRLAYELTKRGAKISIVNLPGKSKLDDFLVTEGKEKFNELVKASVMFDDKEYTKYKVNSIRGQARIKMHIKNQEVVDFIISDLKDKVHIIQNGSDFFLFRLIDQQLFKLDSAKYKTYVEEQYRINASEKEYLYLLESIKTQAMKYGKKTELFKFTHYDVRTGLLYVSKFDGQMYRFDGEEIKLLSNGTDGVLFEDKESYEPYEYLGKRRGDGSYAKYLVDRINFSSSEDVILTPYEQKALWFIYGHTIFFEELQPTKVLLLLMGNKGAGKSMSFRLLLKLLFGKHQNVKAIYRDKEDAFNAAVCAEHLVVFDNVDNGIKWLNDQLASIATGMTISLRELYSNNQNIEFRPRVFVGLTSRTPKFRRDDVADRLVIFNLSTLEKFIPENQLLQEVVEHRNEIYTELFDNLNEIVKHLKIDKEVLLEKFRIADFAQLAWKIGKIVGVEDQIVNVLKKMQSEQSKFSIDGNLVYQALEAWLEADFRNNGRWVTALELFNELKDEKVAKFVTKQCASPNSLAQHLKNTASSIKQFINMEENKQKGRPIQYKFEKIGRVVPAPIPIEQLSRRQRRIMGL